MFLLCENWISFSIFHTSILHKTITWNEDVKNLRTWTFYLLSSIFFLFFFLLKKIHFKCAWQEKEFQHFKKTLFQWNLFMKKVFSFKFLFKSVFIRFNQFNRFNYITFNDMVHYIEYINLLVMWHLKMSSQI